MYVYICAKYVHVMLYKTQSNRKTQKQTGAFHSFSLLCDILWMYLNEQFKGMQLI